MGKDKDRIRAVRRSLEATCGALLGASFVAVLAMLALTELDRALTVSLYSFAVTIPLLSYLLESLVMDHINGSVEMRTFNGVILVIGVLAFIVGVGSTFWHFSKYAGIVFSGLIVLTYLLLLYHDQTTKPEEADGASPQLPRD